MRRIMVMMIVTMSLLTWLKRDEQLIFDFTPSLCSEYILSMRLPFLFCFVLANKHRKRKGEREKRKREERGEGGEGGEGEKEIGEEETKHFYAYLYVYNN